MSILKKCAEILVECGYADRYKNYQTPSAGVDVCIIHNDPDVDHIQTSVQPFSDTLEGIHQFHAIEDWIRKNKPVIWARSSKPRLLKQLTHYGYRLNRVRCCVIQMNYNEESNEDETLI